MACTKQLVPGDEFALRSDGLYCKEDHQVRTLPLDFGEALSTMLPLDFGDIFYCTTSCYLQAIRCSLDTQLRLLIIALCYVPCGQ